MSNSVERERPIDWHGPEGEKARIVFVWGHDDHPMPIGLRITVTLSDGQTQTLNEQTNYKSFLEARDRGITMAKDAMNIMSGRP
ncbi:hypothetical protein [Pseudomonas sp. ACM7]|uniref:hypothetical protein n=1 Tax=Pseudomonas sp. ACM7 TaxID=2052956 RepID=UPI0010108127|nr:hypothetical protein [Pseudomonas sp. ACM7]